MNYPFQPLRLQGIRHSPVTQTELLSVTSPFFTSIGHYDLVYCCFATNCPSSLFTISSVSGDNNIACFSTLSSAVSGHLCRNVSIFSLVPRRTLPFSDGHLSIRFNVRLSRIHSLDRCRQLPAGKQKPHPPWLHTSKRQDYYVVRTTIHFRRFRILVLYWFTKTAKEAIRVATQT